MNTKPNSNLVVVYLFLMLVPILLATSNVTGMLARGILTPNQFTFYRWLFASILLSLFVPIIKKDLPKLKKKAGWLFMWGALSFCLFNVFLYNAFAMGAKGVDAGIIHSLIPIFVVVINIIFFKERVKSLQLIGICVSIFGVVWLMVKGDFASLLSFKFSTAHLLILASAVIYAFYSVDLKKAPDVHWLSIMWGMSIGAMIVGFLIWIFDGMFIDHQQWLAVPNPDSSTIFKALGLIIYVSIFVAILAKGFYMKGVIAIGPNRASLAMNLLPVFNILVPILLFKSERDQFGMIELIACLCVFFGIFLSELSVRHHRNRKQPQPETQS